MKRKLLCLSLAMVLCLGMMIVSAWAAEGKATNVQKNLSADEITVANGGTYDGNAKTPEVTVKDGDTTLTKDTDYTLSYTDNVNAGTAKVTITGNGNYTGTVEKTFSIAKAEFTGKKSFNGHVYTDGGNVQMNLTPGQGYLPTTGSPSFDSEIEINQATKENEQPQDLIKKDTIRWTSDPYLYFDTYPCPVGYKTTFKIKAFGGINYNNYEITVEFTVREKNPTAVSITDDGATSLEYGDTLTLTAKQDNDIYFTDKGKWNWTFDTDTFVQVDGTFTGATSTITLKAIKVGRVTGTITANYVSSEYKGSRSKDITIEVAKKTLNKDDFEIPTSLTKEYDGTNKHSEDVTISLKDSPKGQQDDILKVIVAKEDITYNGENVADANTATLIVPALSEGVQNYRFADDFTTITVPATIQQAKVTTTDIPEQNVIYTGTEVAKATFRTKTAKVIFNGAEKELSGTWSLVPSTEGEKFRQAGDISCTAIFTPDDKNFAPITGMKVTVRVTNRWSGSTPTEVITTGKTGEKVTAAPAEVKNETGTDAAGKKVTIAKITVSEVNQKEILKQAKENSSGEIIIKVSEKEVADGAKLEIRLDKAFIDAIIKDTDAKLTIRTPEGERTFTQEELKKLSEAAEGGIIIIDPASDDSTDAAKAERIAKAKSLTEQMNLVARSGRTAKKNVKVIVKADKTSSAAIKELKDLGFTVKYRFYRSTKKSSGYKSAVTKERASYMNTIGKKGMQYFYRVQLRVYDENGKLIAKTALKQCKYASRIWNR